VGPHLLKDARLGELPLRVRRHPKSHLRNYFRRDGCTLDVTSVNEKLTQQENVLDSVHSAKS